MNRDEQNRDEQILDYNYSDFDDGALAHIMNWMSNQPDLGKKGPDFPIWQLTDDADNPLEETTLMEVIKQQRLTIVEFGSFT